MQTSAQAIRDLLGSYRYNHQTEKELQEGIARILTDAGVRFEREVRLGDAGTIDFVVEGGLGIEVKIKGSLTAMTIQIHRYTRQPGLQSLLVATTLRRLMKLPDAMNGKAVTAVWLGGAF